MILVTGATGFLGSHTIPLLASQYKGTIRCFVRETSDVSQLEKYRNIELAFGSFEDITSFEKALEGVDTLINIASLGFGHGPSIVQACEKMKLPRAIFVSTTAIFTNLNAGTKSVRMAAEEEIRNSQLNYTILRPTMIYGTEKDRNMCRLVKVLKKAPVFPIFGTGEFLQQPIHVDDLAEAIIQAYKSKNTLCKEYNLSGQYPITYNQIIDQTARALGKKVMKVHLPLNLTRSIFRRYEKLSSNPRLKEEQVLRLNEHKDFKYIDAQKDFGFKSRPFKEGIEEEVIRMREKQLL
jgi:nucleoside-diphosphate-sugar epimerase